MAKLALVYGMRLLPAEDIAGLEAATAFLKNGKNACSSMHLIEGTKEDIERQFHTSPSAFFGLYPEI